MKNKLRIAFFDAQSYDIQSFTEENRRFHFDISFFDTRLQPTTTPLAQGHQVACLFVHDIVNEAIADALYQGGIRLLALRSTGYNHVDLEATKNRFPVVRVSRYSPYAVAEFTIGLLLSLNRKIHLAYLRTKSNNFSLVNLQGFDMHQKVAGVIGTGQIGSIVAKLLKGFGMEVLAHDVSPSDELVKEQVVRYVPLSELFEKSDIITLHCPLLPSSKYLINKDSIAQMKKGALLVNTSRGGLVQTSDLIYALKEGIVGGAALDVYEEEESFFYQDFSDSFIHDDVLARLLSFSNVIVSSHQAFFTKEAMQQIASTTLQNIDDFSKGLPLVNQVT